ncbi:AarF/UbiB family protein [Stutzerimonas nosocomialis]|uniref:AarF/UbiB family protein n=1 Tax=Stutzerimonas nosocomialis TaxID=1056496 RepID=UPI0013053538|nr:AarF/UbiB family protein [Stutzerimonas nosocomialis]
MFYLRRQFAGMTPVRLGHHRFHLRPGSIDGSQVAAFLSCSESFAALDEVEPDRGVYRLGKSVLKFNRVKHWKVRLKKHLGLPGQRGHYCLINEFINLGRPEVQGLAPTLHGLGWKSGGLLQDVYLIVEYLEGAQTLDEVLQRDPGKAEQVLVDVLQLFQRMLGQGFVHMDPHPKNIMLMPDGTLKFIDFECCAFGIEDKAATLGFLLGYFYHYWFQRFLSQEHYDRICLAFMEREYPDQLGGSFRLIYARFRDEKVSRKVRYAMLMSPKASAAFVRQCASSQRPLPRAGGEVSGAVTPAQR